MLSFYFYFNSPIYDCLFQKVPSLSKSSKGGSVSLRIKFLLYQTILIILSDLNVGIFLLYHKIYITRIYWHYHYPFSETYQLFKQNIFKIYSFLVIRLILLFTNFLTNNVFSKNYFSFF